MTFQSHDNNFTVAPRFSSVIVLDPMEMFSDHEFYQIHLHRTKIVCGGNSCRNNFFIVW